MGAAIDTITSYHTVTCKVDRDVSTRVQVVPARNDDTDVFNVVHFVVLNGEVGDVAGQGYALARAAMDVENFTALDEQIADGFLIIRSEYQDSMCTAPVIA